MRRAAYNYSRMRKVAPLTPSGPLRPCHITVDVSGCVTGSKPSPVFVLDERVQLLPGLRSKPSPQFVQLAVFEGQQVHTGPVLHQEWSVGQRWKGTCVVGPYICYRVYGRVYPSSCRRGVTKSPSMTLCPLARSNGKRRSLNATPLLPLLFSTSSFNRGNHRCALAQLESYYITWPRLAP